MNQLYESCAVNCNDSRDIPRVEIAEWTGEGYEYREEYSGRSNNVTTQISAVIDAYYCRKHAAEKLEFFTSAIRETEIKEQGSSS